MIFVQRGTVLSAQSVHCVQTSSWPVGFYFSHMQVIKNPPISRRLQNNSSAVRTKPLLPFALIKSPHLVLSHEEELAPSLLQTDA